MDDLWYGQFEGGWKWAKQKQSRMLLPGHLLLSGKAFFFVRYLPQRGSLYLPTLIQWTVLPPA